MKNMLKLLTKFRRLQDANSLIEVALILPVLILMMLAVLDFGLIFNQDLRVADSARAAAEAATLRTYATNTALLQQIGNLSAAGISKYTINAISYCTCANGAGTASCVNYSSCGAYGIPNRYIQVTVTATLPLMFGLTGLPASYKVQSVAIARTPWTGTM